MLTTIDATRYVTPLREGGSLPAIVEASDSGLYVLKFRGAGQGPLALVAELLAGGIGRALGLLGLKIPELVLMDVDIALGRNEPDSEIRELLKASVGVNLGVDYLPGSISFDPAARDADAVDPDLASAVVWFDAFITNVDRTPRNPNLLWWHKVLYLIDHGAALYFHHNWPSSEQMATVAAGRFAAVRDHVLLPWATRIEEADARIRPQLGEELFVRVLAEIPDSWLSPQGESTAMARRAGYLDYLTRRLASTGFVEEAVRARARLV